MFSSSFLIIFDHRMASHLHPPQGTPKPMPFVLSWAACFFVTRIPDFAGRLPGHPPRCCVASMALFACEKKTVESWEVWDFGSNKHFQVMTSSSYHPTRFLCFWCFQGLDLSNLWTRIAFVFFSSRDFPSIFCSNRMISKIFFMNLGKWSTYQRLLLNFLDIYPVYLI